MRVADRAVDGSADSGAALGGGKDDRFHEIPLCKVLSAIQQFYYRIAVSKVIDNIQAAVVLLNAKQRRERRSHGVQQQGPVHAAVADHQNVFPRMDSMFFE